MTRAGGLVETERPWSVLPPHTLEVLLTESEVQARVQALARQISSDYADRQEPLLLVGVLKGAVVFLADLIRNITRPVEYDFVALSSYGAGMESSGQARVLKDIEASVAGKHVLVVEDILDTGLTLHTSGLLEQLKARHAAGVKLCALLDKPSRRRVAVPLDYSGFQIENRFVVGYGMDWAEQYRNLPYVGVVLPTDAEGES